MTCHYENQLLYDWTTDHTDLARLALFVYVRIIWPYLTPPLDMQNFGVEVWLSLHVPYVPGSIPTDNFVVLVIFYCYSVLYFLLSFYHNG